MLSLRLQLQVGMIFATVFAAIHIFYCYTIEPK